MSEEMSGMGIAAGHPASPAEGRSIRVVRTGMGERTAPQGVSDLGAGHGGVAAGRPVEIEAEVEISG